MTRHVAISAILVATGRAWWALAPVPDGTGQESRPAREPGPVSENADRTGARFAGSAQEDHPGTTQAFPRAGHTGPFSGLEPIATRTRHLGGGTVKEVRLVYDPVDERRVRLVTHFETDLETGRLLPVRQDAMVADQVVLSAESAAAYDRISRFARENGFTVSDRLDYSPLVVLRLPEAGPDAVPEVLERLLRAGFGEAFPEPDHLLFPAGLPDDPLISQQWGLDRAEAFGAWEVETGSSDVYIAVLDTGIDRNHPDLFDNIAHSLGRSFTDGTESAAFDDLNGHGTHVSGVAGAIGNNNEGVTGVAWETRIIPIRVGNTSFSISNLIAGLDYVTELRQSGVPVVATNNSYGTPTPSQRVQFRRAVERSIEAGILFVAAAGNSGEDMTTGERFYPAGFALDGLIAVAATDSNEELWIGQQDASNYGADHVHLGAPGADIFTTRRTGTYGGGNSGTSLAAPFVTGTLALMASADPGLEADALKTLLLSTVDPLPSLEGKTITGGRLNIDRAVRKASRAFTLRWDSPAAGFIRIPDPDTGLRLMPAGDRAGVPEPLEKDALTWETRSGPAEITFMPAPDTPRATARFPEPGTYTLRAIYTVDGASHHNRDITVAVGPFDAPAGPEPAAHWSFDGDGPVLTDRSGNERHGELDSATRDTGLFDRALRFDGDTSRATVPAPASERVAFSAWVKSDSRGRSPISLPRILETPEHTFFLGRIQHQEPNHNNVKFVADRDPLQGEFGVWYTEPGSIRDGEWFHLAVSYDGSSNDNVPAIFINGREQTVFTQMPPSGPRPAADNTTGRLGNSEARDRAWDGLIDDVRVFDTLLSPESLTALAYPAPSGVPSTPDGPLIAGREITLSVAPDPASEATGNDPSLTWSTTGGPAEIVFADPFGTVTTATFPEPGEYTLEVEADDGRAATASELTLTVVSPVRLESDRDVTLRGTLFPVDVHFALEYPQSHDRTVSFHLAGDAAEGEDFRLSTGDERKLVIPHGETSGSLTILPLPADTAAANPRTVALSIPETEATSPAGAAATITLLPYTYENWRDIVFDNIPAGENDTGARADAAGDGLVNLLAFALGLNPNRPAPTGHPSRPAPAEIALAGARHPALTFVRPLGIQGIQYRLESSESLESDSWSAAEPVKAVIDELGDGRKRVTLAHPEAIGDTPRRFLRLKVLLPDDDS